ncbi:MAG TPA: FAD-dependent oxidoreductase [Acidimicrobiia bacterium]|nr:FAD-dependent oxidoreductase [Acidimicrobiia bacterium]
MPQRYDLVIVGMGSGGMVAAEFAVSLGLRVAVAERDRVGGDCLWTGCVPSKALLAAGKVAQHVRTAEEFGITVGPPEVDRAMVWERIRRIQAEIASTDDDPARFEAEGIEIVRGAARLTGPTTVAVATDAGAPSHQSRVLETRYVLLATGSRPAVPPIDGLTEAGFVTSENLFELTDPPASFVNIGGGPIGAEMVQAFTRLGIPTTLLQKGPGILPRDEPVLVDLLVDALRAEGVELCFDVETTKVTVEGGRKVVHGTEAGVPRTWVGDELLVAVGRRPNVEGLGLDDLGIETTPKGIVVDNRGRTNVDTVYACGDVAGRYLFTHAAAYEGVRAVRDMFFPGKGKVVASVPWCTFTDPELAHAGMTEGEARAEHGDDVQVWRRDLTHNDRARADGATAGAVFVITHKKKIVGAHILAPAAGEMIHEFALAIEEGVGLSDLSQFMHVYPTVSTSIGQLAGDAAFAKADKLRWLVKRK